MQMDSDPEASGHDIKNIVPIQIMEVEEPELLMWSERNSTVRGSNQSSTRSRYYKQTYRSAWEQMPDFKGWLTGVPHQPRRAYCTYCQKSLHAHRLSLLKHTCTIRHQRAAQAHSLRRKGKGNKPSTQEQLVQTISYSDGEELLQNSADEEQQQTLEYSETNYDHLDANLIEGHEEIPNNMLNESENNIGSDLEEEEEEGHANEILDGNMVNVRFGRRNANADIAENDNQDDQNSGVNVVMRKKQSTSFDSPSTNLGPISTQVIDTLKGGPAVGVAVSLYKLIEGRWTYMNEGITNTQGRFGSFIRKELIFALGRYKLHYDVDRYFEQRRVESVFPFIEVVFDTTSNQNYSFVLLLSPNSYTSYKE